MAGSSTLSAAAGRRLMPCFAARGVCTSTSCCPSSLSSSGRTIGGRCVGCSLQIVRIEPPCTLIHSCFFFGYFSPGYSRRFSSNASLHFAAPIGSMTCGASGAIRPYVSAGEGAHAARRARGFLAVVFHSHSRDKKTALWAQCLQSIRRCAAPAGWAWGSTSRPRQTGPDHHRRAYCAASLRGLAIPVFFVRPRCWRSRKCVFG